MSIRSSYIIGIAGGSASGKTYFLRSIRNHFKEEEVCIISQDNYYRPVSEQSRDLKGHINFDLPEGVDDRRFLDDIVRLSLGQSIEMEEYTFNQPGIRGKQIKLQPAPIIIVEGLFIFYFERISKLLNLKIYMDSRDDIKLSRRLDRDEAERGLDRETILYQWHNHVFPTYKRYLLPFRDEADIIVTNNYAFEKGLEVITDHISMRVQKLNSVK
jgi:uridine kinase